MSLPVNLRLEGRLCVVIGGGSVAKRKCLKLLEFGARVRVVAPVFHDWHEIQSRAGIELVRHSFVREDLVGAFLVIAATDDPEVNRQVASTAREMGILVQQVDAPESSDLIFPATLRRGDLTISFATDGSIPALATKLKEDAATHFGPAYEEFCILARSLRKEARNLLPPPARRELMKELVHSEVLSLLSRGERDLAYRNASEMLNCFLAHTAREQPSPENSLSPECTPPEKPSLEGLSPQERTRTRKSAPGFFPCGSASAPVSPGRNHQGKVFLVGAGPGDPGLLTVKGAECLRKAEAVLYDCMANPVLLEIYSPRAELINVSKRKGCCQRTQGEIIALLIEKAREGKTVVRLKGGDPMIFGRGGEEARALQRAGIAYEIVPGVSSVAAVPAYAGIPVTDREFSSSLGVYTAHRKGGVSISDEKWKSIAQGPDTLVFLMGKTRCTALVEKLIEFGRPPSTPIAVIYYGTTSRQARVVGTLETILTQMEGEEAPGPGLIVVGEVIRAIPEMDWFHTQYLTHLQEALSSSDHSGDSDRSQNFSDLPQGAHTLAMQPGFMESEEES